MDRRTALARLRSFGYEAHYSEAATITATHKHRADETHVDVMRIFASGLGYVTTCGEGPILDGKTRLTYVVLRAS